MTSSGRRLGEPHFFIVKALCIDVEKGTLVGLFAAASFCCKTYADEIYKESSEGAPCQNTQYPHHTERVRSNDFKCAIANVSLSK